MVIRRLVEDGLAAVAAVQGVVAESSDGGASGAYHRRGVSRRATASETHARCAPFLFLFVNTDLIQDEGEQKRCLPEGIVPARRATVPGVHVGLQEQQVPVGTP